MLIEFEIPDDLAEDMDHFKEVNWNNIVIQSIRGCIHDFTILDKLKEFWGVERKKTQT